VIGTTVARLRKAFPDAEVIVADDGSRDRTAEVAEEAGAVVLRLPRRGKGQALSAAERAERPVPAATPANSTPPAARIAGSRTARAKLPAPNMPSRIAAGTACRTLSPCKSIR